MTKQLDGEAIEEAANAYLRSSGLTWGQARDDRGVLWRLLLWLFSLREGSAPPAPDLTDKGGTT